MTGFLKSLRFYLAASNLTEEEVDKVVNAPMVKGCIQREDAHGCWEEIGTAVSYLEESKGTRQFWRDRRQDGEQLLFFINQGT